MSWTVEFHPAFEAEFDVLSRQAKTAIAAKARLLEEFGPQLGRPHADTLVGSKHANMKELRCNADDGVWRVAFAFDRKPFSSLAETNPAEAKGAFTDSSSPGPRSASSIIYNA